MSEMRKVRRPNHAFVLIGKCTAAIFVGCLVGVIAFMVGVSVFSLELSPTQRDPAIFAALFSSGFAALAAVTGFLIGPRVFDGLSGWVP